MHMILHRFVDIVNAIVYNDDDDNSYTALIRKKEAQPKNHVAWS